MADIDGLAVMLVDTPGRRRSDDALEQAAIAASQGEIERADLILHVLDATIAPMNSQMRNGEMVIINKTDRPAAWDFHASEHLPISAKTGEGVEFLRERIAAHFGISGMEVNHPRWWTQRQREILSLALIDAAEIEQMYIP